MALHGFLFHVIQIHNLRVLRRRAEHTAWRNLESHYQNSQWLGGVVGKPVLHAGRQVREIVCAEGMRLITVLQTACALQNKIDFLLAIVENSLAVPVNIHRIAK
jgi:hypothetical protein